MKVHVYGRVSKSNGKRYGENNLDIQFDECYGYCLRKGWTDEQIVCHSHTGSARNSGNLRELHAILNLMEPGDVLVVYAVDRLSRTTLSGVEFLEKIINKGCTLESVYDGLTYGKDIANDSLAFDRYKIRDMINHAELESDRISFRNRRTRQYRGHKGVGPTLSSTRFQCHKRKRNEVDAIDIQNISGASIVLDDHMDIEGVATRSMVRNKRRRIGEYPGEINPDDPDDSIDVQRSNNIVELSSEDVVSIVTREDTRNSRITNNALLRDTLKRYRLNQ